MKKVLVGCGIAFLIVLMIGGYFGYRVYRFASDVGHQVKNVKERYETLNTQIPFEKPDNGLISSDRFGTWLNLRLDLIEDMSEITDSLEKFSIGSVLKIKDRSIELAHAFAEALETVSMSPDEYMWITHQVIGVLNSGDARANPQLHPLIEAFDELDKGDDEKSHKNHNVHSLGMPVTYAQINQISKLLLKNEQPFLSSIKVFYADMALYAIIKGFDEDKSTKFNI
jgi:hypothetical protein